MHMMFNFYVNQHLFLALATEDAGPLAEALEATRDLPRGAQWAHFLRNHDELDLGRLTEEQRRTVFARFAPEESMQLYGRGIRRRLASMLGNRRQEELAYSLLFSLPGTPVIRYGDEIGMGDDQSLPERAAVRTPMQWADAPQGGFSTAEETQTPVISEGVWGYQHVSVEEQRRRPGSLLNTIARLVRLRTECPEVALGDWEVLPTGSTSVLGLRFRWRGRSVVTLHNFADHPSEARLRLEEDEPLLGLLAEERTAPAEGVHVVALQAHEYRWYRLGGSGYDAAR
jgi:maltose alpha-D-glucosyltransferase/alpha-amylase